MTLLPPSGGVLISTLPAPPALPEMPTEGELEAILAMFDELAERDAARRAAKYKVMADTVKPNKREKK